MIFCEDSRSDVVAREHRATVLYFRELHDKAVIVSLLAFAIGMFSNSKTNPYNILY